MKSPSVTTLKKYVAAMSKVKRKYVTAESLSRTLGIYPDVINDVLSFFEPMVVMDYEYNLLELLPAIKEYIKESEEKKAPINKLESISKKDVLEFTSVSDFVYKKYSMGGMINPNVVLSDADMKILKRLINEDLAKRKGNNKRH